MAGPKVSVMMPAYNSVKWIRDSIEHVLKQTLQDFELIVVDDGSTDATADVVTGIHDRRVKFFRKENGGESSARNFGLRKAMGKYVAYCDSDDIFYEQHLELLASYLDQHTDVGLVYSKCRKIDLEGKEIPGDTFGYPRYDWKRFECCTLTIPSITMHRMSCVEKAGYWDEAQALRYAHADWDFFLRFSEHYPLAYLDAVTVGWRRHPENLFLGSLRNQGFLIGLSYLVKKRLLNWKAKRATLTIIAPFDGYYYNLFQGCHSFAQLGEQIQAFKSSDVFDFRIIPLFEEFALMDPHNLEIGLLLGLLYFMREKKSQVISVARRFQGHLGQKLEIEDSGIRGQVASSLKGMALELSEVGESGLAAHYLEKSKEFT